MSIWEKNKKILQKHYSGFLEDLLKSDNDLAQEDIKIETAPTGDPSLCVKGVYVHSPRDPAREGQRICDASLADSVKDGSSLQKSGAVVVLGFGLGYTAQAAAASNRPIIVVEKYKSLLLKALELRDFTDFLSKHRIIFVVGCSADAITGALSIADELVSGKDTEGKNEISVIRNRSLIDLDKEWYGIIEDKIRTWTMRDTVNEATQKRFGRRWIRNLTRNMSAIRDCPGISRLSGVGKGEFPVFLAAAGPSLDLISPLLREIHQRCITIAVDTNLRFFLRHGIQPDFVLVVDPQFWNSRHLDRCVCEKTALVVESAVYPPVMRLPFRKTFLCGSLFPLGEFVEAQVDPKGRLGAGGSVATTAWDFARSLCSAASAKKRDIWIAGLDLSFPGLKTHFRGARFEEKAACETDRFKPVETWVVRALRDGIPFKAKSNSGEQVLTDRRLSLYAAWFENQFANNKEVKNLGLFHNGLAIAGLQTAKAEDILSLPVRREEIDKQLEETFFKIDAEFNEPQEVRKRSERYENIVSVLKRGLKSIKDSAEEGAAIAQRSLKGSLNQAQKDKVLKDLDVITKRIAQSEVKDIAGFLFPPVEDEEKDAASGDAFCDYLRSSLKLFSSLVESAGFNLDKIG